MWRSTLPDSLVIFFSSWCMKTDHRLDKVPLQSTCVFMSQMSQKVRWRVDFYIAILVTFLPKSDFLYHPTLPSLLTLLQLTSGQAYVDKERPCQKRPCPESCRSCRSRVKLGVVHLISWKSCGTFRKYARRRLKDKVEFVLWSLRSRVMSLPGFILSF